MWKKKFHKKLVSVNTVCESLWVSPITISKLDSNRRKSAIKQRVSQVTKDV